MPLWVKIAVSLSILFNLIIFLSLPHYHAALVIITLNKHLYWCFSDLQNKLLQTLWRFLKIIDFHDFAATTKFCFPLCYLATGTTMSSKRASAHSWHLVLAARWELSWVVKQKPLFSSTGVSPGGYLGFTEHNGWGPVRNVPSCRLLKAQPQKCSVTSALLYF